MRTKYRIAAILVTALGIAAFLWWIPRAATPAPTPPTKAKSSTGKVVNNAAVVNTTRTGSNPQERKPSPAIRIGYQEIALYRHLFVAQEKGFFVEQEVRVELKSFASANQMMQALIAGDIDATGLTNLEVALSIEAKDPDRFELANMLVWTAQNFPDYIVVRPDSRINDLKGLEGHAIGLHPGSAVAAFARAVLTEARVDLSKCTFIELQPANMQAAFTAKSVDALYCMDPAATRIVEKKQGVVLLTNPLRRLVEPPIPISGTVLSKRFIRERPKDARRAVRALEKAIAYLRESGHSEEVAGYIAKYTPIEAKLALRMNPSEYWTLSEIDHKRVQSLADKFVDLKIADKRVDVDDFILPNSFLNSAADVSR